MRIDIDLPVFASPTSAFGHASGEIEIAKVPEEGETFPWPPDWLAAKPAYFADPGQSRVSSVTEWEGKPNVSLFGIVCDSAAQARDCAAFLEAQGLFFDCYDNFFDERGIAETQKVLDDCLRSGLISDEQHAVVRQQFADAAVLHQTAKPRNR